MKHTSTIEAAVVAALIIFPCLRAQDTRHVIEPKIPPVCVALTAQLTARDGVLSDAAEHTPDTARIQNAIDGCEKGKAVALRPGGCRNVFLSGPLQLKPGVTLQVDAGAAIFASRNPRDYDITPGACGVPAVQLLSAFHRALLWFSPLSWWMHSRIVRLAEEASDDAALAATKDRVSYAETLLQFMQRGMQVVNWEGVAMARYGKADDRIHRILDGTAISRGLTRFGFATILLLGAPVVFLAAAAVPARPQAPVAPVAPAAPAAAMSGAQSSAPQTPVKPDAPRTPQAPQAPARGTVRLTRYLIVSGDSSSGSWDSRDEPRFREWRSQYGSHFAWFRQDGHDYIVTDEHTLGQLDDATAPQREVNRHQKDVNRHQAEVNHMQEGVNGHQKEVNRAQAEVNRQQSLVNRGGGEQSSVNQLQSDVNSKQHVVNQEQQKVNREQAVVNEEQDRVNQMQTRTSAEIDKAIQAVFDSARRGGLAREVH